MASYYVYSGAGGAGTGADWANAFTTLTLALSGKAAGDIFYIASDHSESSASSLTLTSPGTPATPCYFYSVSRAGSVPPVAADLGAARSASIVTTGNASITINGSGYYWGIMFHAGVSGSTGSPGMVLGSTAQSFSKFHGCAMRVGSGTGGAANSVALGGGAGQQSRVEFDDVICRFNLVGQGIGVGCDFLWINSTAFDGSVFPTNLFHQINGRGGRCECRGLDLSMLLSGKNLVSATSGGMAVYFHFIDCKIENDVTRATVPLMGGGRVQFTRCYETGNANNEYLEYAGTLTTEYTIVLTGGASDGTTPVSWKIVTSANADPLLAFVSPPIAIFNDTTGSAVTATIQGIWGGGAVPDDDEIWVSFEYPGAAGNPQASRIHDGLATMLTTPSGQAAGSGTWGGSTTKFALSCTFTPQQAGPIVARIHAGVASTTFYIDPKITLT